MSAVIRLKDHPEIKIGEAITSGASGCSVFHGKMGGRNVIIKLVGKSEAKLISRLQDSNYVVKLLCHTQVEDQDDHHAIVMEELRPVKFYEEGFPTFEYRYHYRYKEMEVKKIDLTNDALSALVECAKIVDYLHKKNICYNDLKIGNLGYDQNNKLKIYDFGFSVQNLDNEKRQGLYNLHPKQNDILALGKMFLNILSKEQLLCVGRHYQSHRVEWKQENFAFLLEKLEISDTRLKSVLSQMLNLKAEYREDFLEGAIKELEAIKIPVDSDNVFTGAIKYTGSWFSYLSNGCSSNNELDE